MTRKDGIRRPGEEQAVNVVERLECLRRVRRQAHLPSITSSSKESLPSPADMYEGHFEGKRSRTCEGRRKEEGRVHERHGAKKRDSSIERSTSRAV
jgi:hypothetical protein